MQLQRVKNGREEFFKTNKAKKPVLLGRGVATSEANLKGMVVATTDGKTELSKAVMDAFEISINVQCSAN